MGSATGVVDISSDEEDGRRAPGAGNHPPDGGRRTSRAVKDESSNNGLDWVEKLFLEDSDEIWEGSDDSAAMQEFIDSLMDEKNIVVDAKKSLVDDPDKKRPRDAEDDDDDDDCIILDSDPEKAVAIVNEEPRHDARDDELLIIAEKGELACRDFPHARHLCASLPFSTSSHASHCSMCHCYVCDSPAPCALWGKGTGINDHCQATDKDPKWKKLRQLSKHKSQQTPKLNGVQNLSQSSSATSANLMIPSTGRFPISSTVSQIHQMHPSIVVSQNMGQGIIRPRAPSPIPTTRIKHMSQQTPKLGGVQNLLQSSSATSANLMIPSTGRFHISSTVSQIHQMHPSIVVSQNTGQGIIRPRAPSPMPTTRIPSNRSKRARVAPPVYTSSSVNYMQPFVPYSSPMQPAFPRGFQTAQVGTGDAFWSFPDLHPPSALPPLSAAKGSQGYQPQAFSYPHLPPNTVVGTGVPLTRCTSLSTHGKQQQQGPSTDTSTTLRDALTNVAHELGVADYIQPPVGQQSASTPSRTLYPTQLLAQAKACQGRNINPNNVAGQVSLGIRFSSAHNSSNGASGSTVISSDAIQAGQPLYQLNSQRSVVPNGSTPSTVARSLPWNAGGT